ncbi:MAG: 3-deoxy-D-manno-octulosonic acid transferase [Pyrinomonadaceae bacterium]
MYFLYDIIYSVAFLILSPRFLFDAVFNGKYAAGFKQRLGFVPRLGAGARKVIWIHCVSVGEVNAARPLLTQIKTDFPDARLVISTTTRTGRKMAETIFAGVAHSIIYFPFDWRSTVRRSLSRIKPNVVLLMETEIWPNFIRETNKQKARIGIVNGRLSARSYKRLGHAKRFIRRVLGYLDLALMQEKADATRIMSLGLRASKVRVTGNLKFDHDIDSAETALTEEFRERFGITSDAPLIVAASTHSPEEQWLVEAFKELFKTSEKLPRLLIAPRHPERFAEVAEIVKRTGFSWVRRSEKPSTRDKSAEIILLDSIGELRAAYPLAEVAFVGGSLIPHGGQSIYEPAAAGRPIVTGPHTENFESAVAEFLDREALIQIRPANDKEIVPKLVEALSRILADSYERNLLGSNALKVMDNNRGAVVQTLEFLRPILR